MSIHFDETAVDLVAHVDHQTAETIMRFELPHVCDLRPHEDVRVEAWLARWLDGDGPEDDGPLTLEAGCLAALHALTAEQPESCPLLCSQLRRFESALEEWLLHWPRVEPPRRGLFRGAAEPEGPRAPPAEVLELELHAALDFLRGRGGLTDATTPLLPPPVRQATAEHFWQVAQGWIFKLDSLYGLEVLSQPARVAAVGEGTGEHLSLLCWDSHHLAELLRCAFFRPPELSLLTLAQQWRAQRCAAEGVEATSEVAGEAAIWGALIGELLPPEDHHPSLGPEADEASGSASSQLGTDEGFATDEGRTIPSANCGPGAEVESEAALWVRGATFRRVPRRPDCPTATWEDVSAFRFEERPGSDVRHIWNGAKEEQVVGAARQMVASTLPMQGGGGRYRLDLRVTSGTESEAAHYFEVGLVAAPDAGVCFQPGGPGAGRPPLPTERSALAAPFFRLVAVLETLLEGVRLSVEVDLAAGMASVRNLPAVGCVGPLQPTPLGPWLVERAKVQVLQSRPAGELDCPLFREHAQHLQDLISRGTLDGPLAGAVLGDAGARCASDPHALAPEAPEDYYFYVVVPAGLEVEIY